MNNLEIFKKTSTTIKSTELVEIINEFRKLESESSDKKYVELLHKSFITKIEKELKVLETLGFDNQQNILPVTYIDAKGESRNIYTGF